ncbi:DUF3892 domain-containing protein [Microcoleus sp. LAD1_D5]|uniref:DUF3892 domain-containing protein n=1 Tax=Microcoleus sp. LAD1_D5 TaxID=2818813 RepID=UPI002FCFBE55
MAKTIRGNQDGENGENQTYTIHGRGSAIPREQVVEEIKEGKHPHHSIYERDGVEYVRSKPDSETKNNVDPNQ